MITTTAESQQLALTIVKLTERGKGILAADESTGTLTKRFAALKIDSTPDNRLSYRKLLVNTPHCEQYLAGVILYDETFSQQVDTDLSFPELLQQKGILTGIKVDEGLTPLCNTDDEQVTKGLDRLPERLSVYREKGATFTKWRAVYRISSQTPSPLAMQANAEVLARYAALSQAAELVPIVEPEVLFEGEHTLAECEEASLAVLHRVFNALQRYRVKLEYILLKASMVIAGKTCREKNSVQEIAEATVRVLRQSVPCAVPSIHFLSGGQSPEQATQHLNAINQLKPLPWNVSYSYARALQEDCMRNWQGLPQQVAIAQEAFLKRLKLNQLALQGQYTQSISRGD